MHQKSRTRSRRSSLAILLGVATFLLAGVGISRGADSAKPSATPTRTATNLGQAAKFYAWAANSSLPTVAHIQPAKFGERFEIASGPRYTLEAQGFYETTIPVTIGTGSGEHYWVSDKCFNPS